MARTVLILGPTGRFGRHGVDAFTKSGWTVRRFDRKTDDLMEMARGVDVILNGWNPVYTEWAAAIPGLTQQVIAAARISDATVILPGNVYNFGVDAAETFTETTPQSAQNLLGRVRIEMESTYRQSGVKTIVLRAGDFIDTRASGNWFDMIMIKKLDRGIFSYPGRSDIPHAWAFLPDLLRAVVDLAEMRGELGTFEDIPFPGYTLSGTDMCQALSIAAAHPVRLKTMSYLPIRLVSPFWAMGRRLAEMRYLWSKPHRLDGKKFRRLLPGFQPTPLADALKLVLSTDVNPDQPVM